MAKILCDCGGLEYFDGACRMRAQRKGIPVRDARVTKEASSDAGVTALKSKETGTGNMYGDWVKGEWVPK